MFNCTTFNVYIFRHSLQVVALLLKTQVSFAIILDAYSRICASTHASGTEGGLSSSSHQMVLMSEGVSTVFSEGCLATTLDRKDKRDQHEIEETCFQNSMYD